MFNPRDFFGEFLKSRTDWSECIGQFCHVWLHESPWPTGQGPEEWADGLIRGRIVGVDGNGLWFECAIQVHRVNEGEMKASDLHHFFIPFNFVRSVAAPASKNLDVLPEDVAGLKPRRREDKSSTPKVTS